MLHYRDANGEPLELNVTYEYYSHLLKLISIDEDKRGGIFELMEDYAHMKKGETFDLMFDNGFKPVSRPIHNNKDAIRLLDKEW